MLPTVVKVGPHRFEVALDMQVGDRGVNGETYRESCRIVVHGLLAPTIEREVVLHELIHAIWGGTALADAGTNGTEEQTCHALAPPLLLAMLRDNPDLVAYLTA